MFIYQRVINTYGIHGQLIADKHDDLPFFKMVMLQFANHEK